MSGARGEFWWDTYAETLTSAYEIIGAFMLEEDGSRGMYIPWDDYLIYYDEFERQHDAQVTGKFDELYAHLITQATIHEKVDDPFQENFVESL